MAMSNPFAAYNQLFTLTNLTAAMEEVHFQPRRLGLLGWWQEQGLTTLDAWIESRDGVLHVFDVKPRGAPGNRVDEGERRGKSFRVPHIPAEGEMHADEVQGIRAFGTESVFETVQSRIDLKLATMRNSMDYTKEYHRALNLNGEFMDANNTVQSLYTELGVSASSANFLFHVTNDTEGQAQVFNLRRTKIREALGGIPYTGLHSMCGSEFWEKLLKDKGRKQTYLNQPQASQLRDQAEQTMDLWGIRWEYYDGDTRVKIPDNEARLVPTGVPGLFQTWYAPANYAETVNTVGRPYYVKAKPKDYNKGMDMESQSNPLNICTRPQAIIKLTAA